MGLIVITYNYKYFHIGILVYTDGGIGASLACVQLTKAALQQALSVIFPPDSSSKTPFYITTTTSKEIKEGILECDTSLLVMPGGRDIPYCEELNGEGNKKIRNFVDNGGSYLGICAGAYYACEAIEFAKGDHVYEVCGERELKFYPGLGIGPVYPGFEYESNKGAKAIEIITSSDLMDLSQKSRITVHYDGGLYFAPPTSVRTTPHIYGDTCQVLAYYPNEVYPSIVSMTCGKGLVVLSGVHIEASATDLCNAYPDDSYIEKITNDVATTEVDRGNLFSSVIKLLLKTHTN